MDTRLARSFYSEGSTVYGYSLKPYCLLHSVQLEALDNPVAVGGEITPADLIVAAQVCSKHEAVTRFKRHRWRQLRRLPCVELEKWELYLSASQSGPALFERPSNGSGGSLNAPWQQIIATKLQRDLGMSYRDAWTLPEGRILWEYYSLREQQEEDSLILSEALERDMEAQAAWEIENAEKLEAQRAALMDRDAQIESGTWPLDDRGRPVPLNFDTLLPDT